MPNLFERVLFEAEGDDPNINTNDTSSPPDIEVDNNLDQSENLINDDPPDIGDDYSDMNDAEYDNPDDAPEDLNINEKISTVMNANLYKKFLSLVGVISDHISIIKDNNDVIYSVSPKALGIVSSLKKLRENINLYLSYNFINNNYSSNLLFFNKCFNLLNLLDKDFEKNIKQ